MIYLTDFPSPDFNHLGGVSEFWFVLVGDLADFPKTNSGWLTSDLNFIEGKSWLKGYTERTQAKFSEPISMTGSGPVFKPTLEGFIPGENDQLKLLFRKMTGDLFLLKVKDNTGKYRVAGTPAYPLRFTFEFSTGSNYGNIDGYRFKFQGQLPVQSLRLHAPSYIPDENTGDFSNEFSQEFN